MAVSREGNAVFGCFLMLCFILLLAFAGGVFISLFNKLFRMGWNIVA